MNRQLPAVFTSVLAAGLLVVATVGCGKGAVAVDVAGQTDYGSKFILDQEPAGAMSIGEAKARVKPGQPVTLVGRIDAGSHEPWHDGKAAFMLSDALAVIEGHDHDAPGHDPATCPFCSQAISANDTLAIVQFEDRRGEIIATDARQLLGVQKGQLVVVRGRAEVNELGTMVLRADGIYIRR